MTWLHFALWILVFYGAYYGAVIVWDLLRGHRLPLEKNTSVLSFSEQVQVTKPVLAEAPISQDSSVTATGGVDLKQLFALCRDETVEYRKAVSY